MLICVVLIYVNWSSCIRNFVSILFTFVFSVLNFVFITASVSSMSLNSFKSTGTVFAFVKRIMLCNCLSSCCCFSASLIWNIGEIGEKKLFYRTSNVLQTIKQPIQYTVLDIHFRSLKYTAVIRIWKNLSNFPFLSKR